MVGSSRIEGLAQYLGLDIEIFEDLREKHFTDHFVGEDKLWWSIKESFNDFEYQLPGGESNADCQRRAIAVIKSILKQHAGKNIAIGTHGMVMTLMMSYFDASYGFEFLKQLTKPDLYKLEFEAAELKHVTRLWNE